MQWLLPLGAVTAGIFSVAYSVRFVHDVFFNGAPVNLPRTPHEPPFFMRLPVLLLALLCVAVGRARRSGRCLPSLRRRCCSRPRCRPTPSRCGTA